MENTKIIINTEDFQSSIITQLQEKLQQKLTPIEQLIQKVGSQGKYQFITFFIFCSQWLITSWLLLGGAFFFQTIQFKCEGLSSTECNKMVCTLDSSQWLNYLPNHPKSIPYQFKPIYMCNNSYLVTVLESLVFIGSLIGFLVIPYIADNWGRKKGILISWTLCTIGILILSFAVQTNMVGIGLFLAGFGGNPAITLSYSFIYEQSLGKSRQYFSIGIQIAFAIGQGTIGIIFYEMNNWRKVTYIILIFAILINIMLLYVQETPKFMIFKDAEQTLIILNKIAKINKKQLLKIQEIISAKIQQSQQMKQDGTSILDLFRYKSLRQISIITAIVFFGIQVVYYSTSFNIANLGLSMYLSQLIIGISQALGYIAAQIFIPYLSRKKVSLYGMGLSSAFCIILAFIVQYQLIISICILVVFRFILCMFWVVYYIYLAQLFPTRVRSLALGWNSAAGTLGSSSSPYFLMLSAYLNVSGWLIPGLIGFIATLCILRLKQTLNTQLQDEIQQLKMSRQ